MSDQIIDVGIVGGGAAGLSADTDIYRSEHPRPQFHRDEWINLNGRWSYAFDFGRSGVQKGYCASKGFDGRINIPFCVESELSGVGYTDYIDSIWYHRNIVIPKSWSRKHILLHFAAVDYEAHIYVDGKKVAAHYGGSASFTCELTGFVEPGETHHLVVHAKDDIRSANQPGGKQSLDFYSAGCFYTRVTGIWQTVWLEAVSPYSIRRVTYFTDIDNGSLTVSSCFRECQSKSTWTIKLMDAGRVVAESKRRVSQGSSVELKLDDALKLWSPESPFLYDLEFELQSPDGETLDRVRSYVGMRKISVEKNRLYLNNNPLYLRFVLDQGFYPDGIWTAPSDEALKKDILLAKNCGFNGARLHQKVFEERYHYWADKLGYLTWAESPSWGLNVNEHAAARNFLSEWREIIIRDVNHPSIIGWTPLNETWDVSDPIRHSRFHHEAYDLTKSLDVTRPINGASGGCQVVTDLYCVHVYEQDPALLTEILTPGEDGSVYSTLGDKEAKYIGQPYIVDEFGGIKWNPCPPHETLEEQVQLANAWGYGIAPSSLKEFRVRLERQVDAILAQRHISGYCYTQLTDVEQEQNGIFNYDRTSKQDLEEIRRIFNRNPEWFKEG